ncbi:acyl-CoA carboxylase epsilon subunit [Actinokineospora sp. G85]|uniref:acyl-CoA carboxylase epsilon subunit n=1 Tax=Actinokineospora sp. G85 TaxID=3406626 RepID=UPI003C714481
MSAPTETPLLIVHKGTPTDDELAALTAAVAALATAQPPPDPTPPPRPTWTRPHGPTPATSWRS